MITRTDNASVSVVAPETTPAISRSTREKRSKDNFNPHVIERRVRRLSRRRLFSFSTLGWSINDAVISFLSVLFGYVASPVAGQVATSETIVQTIPCAITFALILLPTAHIAGLHDPRRRSHLADLVVRCLVTVLIAIFAMSMAWMIFSFLRVGRYVMVLTTITSFIAMVATRVVSWNWTSAFKQKICFIGDDRFCSEVAQFIDEHPLAVTISDRPGGSENLGNWAASNEVDEVVFDGSNNSEDLQLLDCLDAGVKVSSYSDFIEEKYHRIPVDNIDAKWLFSARLDLAHPYYQGVKRMVDLVTALVGLALTAPMILLAALVVKLESKGPAFYSQVRVGRFNRPFRIYKLRTMVNNSETSGAQWATKNDSRITAVGKFLRKTRLDELPQFWNVLKGEMSLVGPRPERPEFVEDLGKEIPFYLQRHLVKPGLTGWAQINYPYGASVEDSYNKLTYDFYYIKNASMGLDLQIFLRTIGTVMKGSR